MSNSNIVAEIAGVGSVPVEWLDKPFSLSCIGCDAGMGIVSLEQAALEGWRAIRYDDGPFWNFLGYCPHCGPEECGHEWSGMKVIDT